MKIKEPNTYKELIINKLHGLLYKLEHTGDSDYVRSGEASFIKDICADYKDTNFVLFDVGANKGEYTEMILNEIGAANTHAYLFEPQSSCVAVLKQKFLNKNNISVNAFALSSTKGSSTLFKDADQSGFASIYKRNLDHYAISLDKEESIDLETGASFVQERKIKKINLLKVDVEGHEMEVFAGFESFLHPDNIDYIQFEYGGANLDSHTSLLEIHNLLSDAGFVVCKMMRSHLEMRPYHPRFENFMYQNWVAVSPRVINTT